jgi:prepilin-type N-terminal cleavage/methylation domain-containing protein
MKCKPKDASPAFTLVELLVVITMIAALAAAIFAMAPLVRGKALMAADTQKLRDIATAVTSFAADNNMTLPCESTPISRTNTSESAPPRFCFHKAVDRYLGPVSGFNPRSIYNFQKRPNSPFFTQAAKAPSGYKPTNSKLATTAFSYNGNVNNGSWKGKISNISNPAEIVYGGEVNIDGSGMMQPANKATLDRAQPSKYRVSRLGKAALYLYRDFHDEPLMWDCGTSYYKSNTQVKNIWHWW